MTDVIFLVSWNGYDDGQRVSLPTSEANRLIEAKICALDNPVPSVPTGPGPVAGGGKSQGAANTVQLSDGAGAFLAATGLSFASNTLEFSSGLGLRFNSASLLNSFAANTLALSNGSTAQTLQVFNTRTDASNYERGFMRWASNVLEIGTEK
jgi:hypothetical protein